ncbi:MAG: metallophosphoesterase family protein [Minwuia sp.]|nr:metallophosphoesterase family protein [Minwuia sp.]
MQPALPRSQRIYAIGDVHGRADCLNRLLKAIANDLPDADKASSHIVFLGDYVDRADDSREVIDHCIDFSESWPGQVVFLRGNHEEALMAFLQDPLAGRAWLSFGGLSTLMSYGVADIASHSPEPKIIDARDQFDSNIPESHRQFYAATAPHHVIGNIFLCHAGIDPSVGPKSQSERTLFWGDNSGEPGADWPYIVVHGHYVIDQPENTGQRINVDTGAYYSGVLTAACIDNTGVRFIAS